MERAEALRKLKKLVGTDLHDLRAAHPDVTFEPENGKVNKGWAGHLVERYLGVPLNSSRAPNFGSWELKIIPLKYLKNGDLTFKETMAICMIDPVYVVQTPFRKSHVLDKLRKMVIVARVVGPDVSDPQIVHSATSTGLDGNPELHARVEADYEEVRECIKDSKRGFSSLTGRMGKLIQPRTKGSKNSQSRAFYARKEFLREVISLGS